MQTPFKWPIGRESELCPHLGRENWKNTYQVIESHNGTEGSRCAVKKFVEWTKPKSNALAAAANFRCLEQGDLSLAEYTDKATILCDQCEYLPKARDRLLRDAIVIGLRSKEAYYKCAGRGNRNRSESRCHNTPGWIYATRIQSRPTTNRNS